MSETKRIRILAIGLMAGLLLVAGALLSIPFLVREPLPVVGPGSRVSFGDGSESSSVAGQLQISRAGDFVIVMGVKPAEANATPPRLILEMPDHEMPPLEPKITPLAADRFSARGTFTMPGRWRMRILQETEPHTFEFILREF